MYVRAGVDLTLWSELMLDGARCARDELRLETARQLYAAALSAGARAELEAAEVLLAAGAADAAAELLEEAAQRRGRDPERAEVVCALADARLRAGQPARGLAALDELARSDRPAAGVAWLRLAEAHQRRGDPAEAAAAF